MKINLECYQSVLSPTDAQRELFLKTNHQSHYRPEVPRGLQEVKAPDYMTMAEDGGKVVSLTHRPPLPPGNTPGTHFCLEAESTPGP